MLKSLTLSMSFALALGFAGAVQAGGLMGHGSSGCSTCGLASPQGVTAAPQASAQGSYVESCGETCAPAKSKCDFLKKCFAHKPKMYTYEWVLKKKRVHGHKSNCGGCDACGGTESYVTPSAQYASPQGTYAAPQATYGTAQYGSGQTASVYPTTELKAAEPAGDAVPPAPSAPAPSAPAARPRPPRPVPRAACFS